MTLFKRHSDYSQVTAILPRQSTHQVVEAVLASGARHVLTQSARGCLIKARWYQAFLPTLSPEQEILTFLVPGRETDPLMEQIAIVGKLELYGAGALFATPCRDLICDEAYPLWEPGDFTFESVSFDIKFRRELVALILITDKDNADAVSRAAIRAGAPGPTISFVRGYGLRDRLGLLRITKRHEKELVLAVVDRCDADAVAQAMAAAGSVDQPGRGILYQVPASKGLTNLASVFHPQKHSASIQQIIKAIDELQGSANWRARQLLIHDPEAAEFRQNHRGTIRDLVCLNLQCRRKDTDDLVQVALRSGAPGASVSYWRFAEREAQHTSGGLRINREIGCISMIVPPGWCRGLIQALRGRIQEEGMENFCFFSHAVPVGRTFVSSPLAGGTGGAQHEEPVPTDG